MRFRRFLDDAAIRAVPERVRQLEEMRMGICEYMRGRGIDFVDLSESLRGSDTPAYYLYDQHFNETGHRIAAEQLYRFLVGSGIAAGRNKAK